MTRTLAVPAARIRSKHRFRQSFGTYRRILMRSALSIEPLVNTLASEYEKQGAENP
jgi:hypothetical protein